MNTVANAAISALFFSNSSWIAVRILRWISAWIAVYLGVGYCVYLGVDFGVDCCVDFGMDCCGFPGGLRRGYGVGGCVDFWRG